MSRRNRTQPPASQQKEAAAPAAAATENEAAPDAATQDDPAPAGVLSLDLNAEPPDNPATAETDEQRTRRRKREAAEVAAQRAEDWGRNYVAQDAERKRKAL